VAKKLITYQVQYSCVIEVEDNDASLDLDGIPCEVADIEIPEPEGSPSKYRAGSFEVISVRDVA